VDWIRLAQDWFRCSLYQGYTHNEKYLGQIQSRWVGRLGMDSQP